MKAPYEGAIEGFTSLVSEFIDDDDLRAKLDFESQKLKFELDKVLLSTKTHPKVDAFVKILIATRDIIIPMLRPLGAAYMSYIGLDIGIEQVLSGEEVSGFAMGLAGTFPAWGASRHNLRSKEIEKKRNQKDFDGEDYS